MENPLCLWRICGKAKWEKAAHSGNVQHFRRLGNNQLKTEAGCGVDIHYRDDNVGSIINNMLADCVDIT